MRFIRSGLHAALVLGSACALGMLIGLVTTIGMAAQRPLGVATPVAIIAMGMLVGIGLIFASAWGLKQAWKRAFWRRELIVHRTGAAMPVVTLRERGRGRMTSIDAPPNRSLAVIARVTVSRSSRFGTSSERQLLSLQIIIPDHSPFILSATPKPDPLLALAQRWSELTGQRVLVDPGVLDLLAPPRKM